MKHDTKELLEMLDRYQNRVRFNFSFRGWLNKKGISCVAELERIKEARLQVQRIKASLGYSDN